MSINIKKIPKIYKILQYKNLLELIFFIYLAQDYQTLILTCRKISNYLRGRVNDTLKYINTKFNKIYQNQLKIINCSIRYQKNYKQTFKKDIMISFNVKNFLQKNLIYSLGFSYLLKKKKKQQKYFWKYQFQIVGNQSRTLWMYKQQTKNHYMKDSIPYTIDIMPVRVEDTLVIAIPYFCGVGGFINLQDINFYKLEQKSIKNMEDLICTIQNAYQWIPYSYYENPLDFQIEDIIRCYPQHLKVQSISYNDLQIKNYRINLICQKKIKARILGHTLNIKQFKETLKIELKKKGCYDEKYKNIPLRIGDNIIIYMTQRE